VPPKPKKPVQSAKQIARVKKAVPKVSAKRAAKPSVRPPTQGSTKPKTKGSKEPRNPAQRPGSQSIPYQGPGPMGQGVF
jgi:hypothetical protein